MSDPRTPYSRLIDQIEIADQLSRVAPADVFRTGNGGKWFLCLAQGIERTQQYALACEGVKFGYLYRDASQTSS